MSVREFIDKLPVIRHVARIVDPEGYSGEEVGVAVESPPPQEKEPNPILQFYQKKKSDFEKIFSASPAFRELKPEEREAVLSKVMRDPKGFLEIVSKDPTLSGMWGELSEDEKKEVVSRLYASYEKPLKEPYLDPTTWLPVGAVHKLVTKGAGKFVETVGAVATGDVVGETAKQAYEATTGKDAPWWVGVGADVLSGLSPDIARTLLKKGEKTPIKESDVLKVEDLQTALEKIDPPELPRPRIKLESPKEALEFFERELLGKEVETPVGIKVRFKKKDFLALIAGGKRKGFVEGARTPEESYDLIKRGVESEKIKGLQRGRLETLYVVPDILSSPHIVTREPATNRYVFYKEYKVNGTKGFVSVIADKEGNVDLVSFYPKKLREVLKKVEQGKEEIVYVPRGLSPGRTTAATGYAPGELTDSIGNNIIPAGESIKGIRIEDIQTALENIEPPPLPKLDKKLSSPKEALEFFEKELLGKEIETPIGLKVKFNKRHFLNIISGGKKKGFVEGARTPEESYELIKRGIEPEKIGGFQAYRARDLYLIPDILQNPHIVTLDKKKGYYTFYKAYKVNGVKGYASVVADNNGDVVLVSFHKKGLGTILNKIKSGEEELIMAGGLSPGRATSATGYAPGELTDSIKNKIAPPDEEIKFRSGGPSLVEAFRAVWAPVIAGDKIISRLTGKIKDTKIDKLIRRFADPHGLRWISRAQKEKFLEEIYYPFKGKVAEGDLLAEEIGKKARQVVKRASDEVVIKYLENPKFRALLEKETPDIAEDLKPLAEEIRRASEELYQRGWLLPEQMKKWGDRYLTRIYALEGELQGIDLRKGLRAFEIQKGRKIKSIMDLPKEVRERLGYVEDAEMAVKATIAKQRFNIAFDDFTRKLIADPELVDQDYVVRLPESLRVGKLPELMSPYWARKKVIPYLRTLLKEGKINEEDFKAFVKEVREKGALLESVRDRYRKKGFAVLGDKEKLRYGVLSGLPVNRDLYGILQSLVKITDPEDLASKADIYASRLLAVFKFMKVPGNFPFAHARNFISNLGQWMLSGADPLNAPVYIGKAVKHIAKKDRIYREALERGLFKANWASEEVVKILRDIKVSKKGAWLNKLYALLVKGEEKIGNVYGWIDDIWKFARYLYAREVEKLPPEKAVRVAQDAHFDYSLTYPLIRMMREPTMDRGFFWKIFGSQFPTFMQKILGYMYESALDRPVSMFLAVFTPYLVKQYIESRMEERYGEDYRRARKALPDWMDDPYTVVLMGEDRSITVLPIDYFLPWGAWSATFDALGGYVEKSAKYPQWAAYSSAKEAIKEVGGMSNPYIRLAAGLYTGKDPFFERDIGNPLFYAGEILIEPGALTKLRRMATNNHPATPRFFGLNVYKYDMQTWKRMLERKEREVKEKIGEQEARVNSLYRKGKITSEERIRRLRELKEIEKELLKELR